MFLYCLVIPGSMENDGAHNATDDCALCKAWSKKGAIKKEVYIDSILNMEAMKQWNEYYEK